MQQIDMSGKLPMGSAADAPRVRCSAAYPTRAERGLRRGNYCVTLTVSEGSDPKNTPYYDSEVPEWHANVLAERENAPEDEFEDWEDAKKELRGEFNQRCVSISSDPFTLF